MRAKPILTVALLVLALGGAGYVLLGGEGPREAAPTGSAASAALPADGVVVYYFHGNKRCATCNKMEALAEATLHERFAARLRDGSVVFRAVNVETDATRHFVSDFELASKAVVMVERRDGEDLTWRRLDAIWEKIADDQAYRDYIAENLAACLAELGHQTS
jgi:hypothetical protein